MSLGQTDFERPARAARPPSTLPSPFNPNDRASMHQTAAALRRARLKHGAAAPPAGSRRRRRGRPTAADRPIRWPRCPDRRAHVRAAAQAERIRRELADLDRRIGGRTESLARRFDRVLRLLEAGGATSTAGRSPTRASVLAHLYHEADLLVAEAIAEGLLDDLDARRPWPAWCRASPTSTAARTPPPPPWFPSADVRDAVAGHRGAGPASWPRDEEHRRPAR